MVGMKIKNLLCIGALLVSVFMLIPQTLSAEADGTKPLVTTERYTVFSDFSQGETLRLLLRIEELHEFYGQYFLFKDPPLTETLHIRYFSSKSGYDDYLRDVLGRTYDHFVLLDYNSELPNELVIYAGVEDFDRLLAHYSFIQFLEGQVEHPPLWLREGYALYFENSRYDSDAEGIRFRENSRWLEELKNIIASDDLIPLDTLLNMGYEEIRVQRNIFYPQVWGLVSFLTGYRERGNEELALEVNGALDSAGSEEDNLFNAIEAIRDRISLGRLERAFVTYIRGRQSFTEAVTEAIGDYQNQNVDAAERAFYSSVMLNPQSPTPYYYLGLINYERDDYTTAEYFYIESLARGGDEGVIYYALGLNTLAGGEYEQARDYLEQAREQKPELRSKIDEVLRTFPGGVVDATEGVDASGGAAGADAQSQGSSSRRRSTSSTTDPVDDGVADDPNDGYSR